MDRACKQCSFLIFPKHLPKDIKAQGEGFCSDLCKKLYSGEKAYLMDHEESRDH